ncbi:helix-turn-helix domain-containing protein [Mucilaginibacter lappiensis]|uniref:Transcriptional regulator with XRE-family HTH domain n=1 Tax=Mucilaginibacter lappiensis TaxID=354630 RepID=A0A841JGY5_9SPHI|nr:helix-turn-helix transcriptional regulator [Mucilaginibacter lappiensis]MBB6130150.1 transcriptional regulator with XRE-family HTH domain [Mucilaginibacter lappiensis]
MATNLKSDIEAYVINKVKEKREQQNLSQAELAVLLNVSNGFIGQAESSKSPTKYNLNHLNQLAIVFGCSVKDFIPEKPFRNAH